MPPHIRMTKKQLAKQIFIAQIRREAMKRWFTDKEVKATTQAICDAWTHKEMVIHLKAIRKEIRSHV